MAARKYSIPNLGAVKEHIGTELGATEWIAIDQARIDAFAEVTNDHQWIHCDVERASRESPWKTTIAHGYLTLSLVPDLLSQLVEIGGWETAVNTGLDKCRFSAPVPAGSRVRMKASIKDARDLPHDGVRITFGVRLEVEGAAKPALLASVNYAYFPG